MNAVNEFSKAQQAYLQGLVMGADVARAVRGLPVLSGSGASIPPSQVCVGGNHATEVSTHLPAIHLEALRRVESEGQQLVAEEKAKRVKDVLEMWSEIDRWATAGEFPKGTDVFLTKYHGLFYVAPAQNAFMCRMRLPGGVLTAAQLDGVANLAEEYAGGFADVTTRANLQLREIAASNAMNILIGLRELGIVTTGSGADNIRNVTASPLGGIDPTELLDTIPLAKKMHYHILHRRELYGLPRKFNIAFCGSGQVSSLAETNDISFHAVRVAQPLAPDTPADVYLLLKPIGGITGHGDFARSTSVLVKPQESVAVAEAIVRVFIKYGDRTDRRKARLKYLLDAWGFDKFLTHVEREFGQPLRKVKETDFFQPQQIDRWAHVGVHPQRQVGTSYIGVILPVGRLTVHQMRGLAELSNRYGAGKLRLTVWQNVILSDIKDEYLEEVLQQLELLQLSANAASIRAGLVACTGNTGCKYAASNTKSHALSIAEHLDDALELDQPVNIHVTGCHHSCAQHAIGDIGLLATKVSAGDEMLEGYHILVGGATGAAARIGTAVFESVTAAEAPHKIEVLLRIYLEQRLGKEETFERFVARIGAEKLKELAQHPQRQALTVFAKAGA